MSESEVDKLKAENARLKKLVPSIETRRQNFRTKWSLMGVPADQIEAHIEREGESL